MITNFENIGQVLEGCATLKKQLLDNFYENNAALLNSFSKRIIEIKERNQKDSFLFNSLRFFGIGETMHSFLLGKLLDPNAEHGQGKLFLNLFLDQIGIEHEEKDIWIVTAEKGRIDIMIKRHYPKPAVIVIENKSNGAVDQENQLYRYWLSEMFFRNEEKDYKHTLGRENKSYRLIYLSPNDTKKPNLNSLSRPAWVAEKYSNLPEILCEIYDVQLMTFDHDIVEWLEKCVNSVEGNHRLKEYINQYAELWQN